MSLTKYRSNYCITNFKSDTIYVTYNNRENLTQKYLIQIEKTSFTKMYIIYIKYFFLIIVTQNVF